MRYADRKLLERWARLQLAISIARSAREGVKLEHNVGRVDRVDSSNLFKSVGWRALRNWFRSLSPRARRNAVQWMSIQLEGVEKIKRAIGAEGGTFDPLIDLADIDFTIRTDDGTEAKPLSLGDDAGDQPVQEHEDNEQRSPDRTDEQAKA
jgi:hypothetical protein